MRARFWACRFRTFASWGHRPRAPVLAHGQGVPVFDHVDAALMQPDTQVRLFGKPRVAGHRRVAVTLARGDNIDAARATARDAAAALVIHLESES